MNLLLKFSGLYDDELFHDGTVLDFRELEGTNSYCSPEARQSVLEALESCETEGIHWIDGGDYHYVSEIFLSRLQEPFALVLFDNHSDEQDPAFGGDILSCGNWVAEVKRRNAFLREFRRNLTEPAIPADLPVYISLDIDVLSEDYARTDWDQGSMTLPELEGILRGLLASHRILGVDICGGISVAQGASGTDLGINLALRTKLLELLSPAFHPDPKQPRIPAQALQGC